MKNFSRRKFIKLLGGAGAGLAASSLLSACYKTTSAKVVIVGGGFGGSTCAKYLHRFDNSLEITLIELSTRFITCPFSNMVINGMQTMDNISHDYMAQANRGVNVVHGRVQAIDPWIFCIWQGLHQIQQRAIRQHFEIDALFIGGQAGHSASITVQQHCNIVNETPEVTLTVVAGSNQQADLVSR